MISSPKNLFFGVLLCSSFLLSGCQTLVKPQHEKVDSGSKIPSVVPEKPISPQMKTNTQNKTTENGALTSNNSTSNASSESMSPLGLCQNELAALKKISPRVYAAKKADFDRLVNKVSVYGAVRGEVSSETTSTLDALYKYKTNQLCADIKHAVLKGLIKRGESAK